MNKFLTLLTFILLFAGQIEAQQTITGQVKDKNDIPLPGVNIAVKQGSTVLTGTITDLEGKYSIPNVPKGATLVFTFIGMLNEELIVGDNTTINLTMVEDVKSIDEVVVVGYGSQKRAHLTGAVTSISSTEIQDIPA